MKKVLISSLMFLFSFLCFAGETMAQCPMCKIGVENQSELNSGTSHLAAGLNVGIIYLFVIPYILIGAVSFLWYRSYRQKKASEHSETAHS